MPYFLQKITMKKIPMSSAAILLDAIKGLCLKLWIKDLEYNLMTGERYPSVYTYHISYLKTNISFWVLSKIDYSAGSSCSL